MVKPAITLSNGVMTDQFVLRANTTLLVEMVTVVSLPCSASAGAIRVRSCLALYALLCDLFVQSNNQNISSELVYTSPL